MPHCTQELDLVSYARLVCALLDVPVAEGGGGGDGGAAGRPLLEALHHLFALLLEFRANPFFAQALAGGGGEAAGAGAL